MEPNAIPMNIEQEAFFILHINIKFYLLLYELYAKIKILSLRFPLLLYIFLYIFWKRMYKKSKKANVVLTVW